jgi:hypothetical protein
LRSKGAALRASLYDLTNSYVTAGKTVKVRPGTYRRATVTGTKGLIKFGTDFHVFSDSIVSVPAGYETHVLSNPQNRSSTVARIHFVAPYMGFLYVVAEFSDGTKQHFWLQDSGEWTANTIQYNGNFILPTVPTGLAYAATRLEAPHSLWQPNIAIAVNDIFEPTVYNGFMYKAIAVAGDSPHTGATEPVWPTTENAQIQEFGDFDVTNEAGSAGSSSAPTPGRTITDRYGNSSVFTSNIDSGTATGTPPTADTAVINVWQPGTFYAPGAVVRPSTSQGGFVDAIPNGDFESGGTGWIFPGGSNLSVVTNPSLAYQGTNVLQATLNHQTSRASMATAGTVIAGQSVTATAYVNPNNSGANMAIRLNLAWYDNTNTLITRTAGVAQTGGGYRQATVSGSAPSNAVGVKVEVEFATGTNPPGFGYADIVSWNLESPVAVSEFLFEAVQASVGTSASTEPVWPSIAGGTVVDNTVTWEAIGTSIVTWQALPIMKTGATEPTWPTTVGNTVADGNMTWTAADRSVVDAPHSSIVAIAASKVFAADDDIIRFSATTNCLDWTTENDAGFLPFGLQTYGSQPCAMLGLYRSNLAAFNALGYQVWQVDEDPANMALLDASPVPSTYAKAGQPVQNDFVMLTEVGIRSLGIAGASTNLQAGQFGKQVDPLVKTAIASGLEPRGLFYPGQGQYMLFFGPQAFVLTLNGGSSDMSWSRYIFPENLIDWTVSDGKLYIRTESDHVWELSEAALYDDIIDVNTHVTFTGLISWPFLDYGVLGGMKDLEGLDVVCTGEVTISIGYDQSDFSLKTPDFTVSGDTLPGVGMIPMPLSAPSYQVNLTFSAGQAWEWEAANIYVSQVPAT